jgi:hypothetical protein
VNDLQIALKIADTVSKASPGTTISIYIAQGSYFPSVSGDSSISFSLRNNVHIFGGYSRDGSARDTSLYKTILSGSKGSFHIIKALNVDITSQLDGVTISGGNNNGLRELNGAGLWCVSSSPKFISCSFIKNSEGGMFGPTGLGGAIYDSLSSPIIVNCTFNGNSAYNGGAIYNILSSPTLSGCIINNNHAGNDPGSNCNGGAGICNISSSPIIDSCIFSNNYAPSGGAISNLALSFPIIFGCTFQSNSANEFQGGAIRNLNSQPSISNCNFIGNYAGDGGGGAIYNSSSSPKISGCSFSKNTSNDSWSLSGGGAIANWNSSSPIITNCTFVSNAASGIGFLKGGAIYESTSSSIITNCTFTLNSASIGGAYYGISGSITNCIFWRDTALGAYGDSCPELSANMPNVKSCVISGGYLGGTSIITSNPNLGILTTDNGGPVPTCAIKAGSPAQNAGTTLVPFGVDISTDARGMLRSDKEPDIGAYEAP